LLVYDMLYIIACLAQTYSLARPVMMICSSVPKNLPEQDEILKCANERPSHS